MKAALLVLLALAPLAAGGGEAAAGASRPDPGYADPGYDLLRSFLSAEAGERRDATRRLVERRDPALVPGLVDALFFIPRDSRTDAFAALEALSGERPGRRYQDWIELVGRRPDLAPAPGYLAWKAELFARIDPRYKQVLYPGAPSRLRLPEVISGGVGFEGIPALDNPRHVPAAEAGYLKDGERVFGVSLGGAQRAYPLRILDWHEMANDVVGGEPVTLSYCTLCGAGVLFSTRTPNGNAYTFGTSGLLYRSNKLMVDRQTLTLWSNLTGEPQVGRLANGPARLAILPLTLTTWKEWRTRHPGTTVLALDEAAGRRWGFDYRPGAADRRRAGVRFPVPARSDALGERDEVFALRLDGRAKAYPVEAVLAARVLNDRLGEDAVVLVGDPESGAVRAYRRGAETLRPVGAEGAEGKAAREPVRELVDESGGRWRVDEDALVPLAAPTAVEESDMAENGAGAEAAGAAPPAPLPRLPGHRAYWFGWYAFFPDSELYGGPAR